MLDSIVQSCSGVHIHEVLDSMAFALAILSKQITNKSTMAFTLAILSFSFVFVMFVMFVMFLMFAFIFFKIRDIGNFWDSRYIRNHSSNVRDVRNVGNQIPESLPLLVLVLVITNQICW